MSTSSETVTGTGLRRDAGVIGLLFASTTSMIGSGWLFGALHASKIAGPLSLLSWILGAIIIMLIALCFAELASLFPRAGALVHMSHASHGEGLGRVWGWMLFSLLCRGFWPAVAVTAIWSLIVIELAKRSSLPVEETGRILIQIERTA